MCAKNLRELCALCERKKCPLWEKKLPSEFRKCSFSHRVHRRTEHTKAHRDIKSTDFTERYSHRGLTPLPHSFQEHVLPHSRTRPSPFENMPFYVQEHALLDAWQGPSLTQPATCWFHACYRDEWSIHTERKFNTYRQNDRVTYNDRKNMLSRVFNGYRHNDIKTYNDRKKKLSSVFNVLRQNDKMTKDDKMNILNWAFNIYK